MCGWCQVRHCIYNIALLFLAVGKVEYEADDGEGDSDHGQEIVEDNQSCVVGVRDGHWCSIWWVTLCRTRD